MRVKVVSTFYCSTTWRARSGVVEVRKGADTVYLVVYPGVYHTLPVHSKRSHPLGWCTEHFTRASITAAGAIPTPSIMSEQAGDTTEDFTARAASALLVSQHGRAASGNKLAGSGSIHCSTGFQRDHCAKAKRTAFDRAHQTASTDNFISA